MITKYIFSNGLSIAYDEFGDTSNPAILLIMGLGTQMIAWPEVLCEDLAARGFRIIRFDNRDVGLSEKIDGRGTPNLLWLTLLSKLRLPLKVPYTLDDMADDAISLLDALKIKKAHIVGASMGGMIGQLLTASNPERVLSFTSIMSTSGRRGLPTANKKLIRAMLRPSPSDEDKIIENRVELYKLIGSVGELASSPEESREKALRSYKRSYYPDGYTRQVAAIMHNGSREKQLKKINRPSLVIHGKSDPLVPVEAGIDTARLIANSELELIDNMGHDLPIKLMPTIAQLISSHALSVID